MSKDCPNCPAFGKHCPHKVNGDPYYYNCSMTIEVLEKENAELKADNDARKFAMAMSEKVEKQLREENAELKSIADFQQSGNMSRYFELKRQCVIYN